MNYDERLGDSLLNRLENIGMSGMGNFPVLIYFLLWNAVSFFIQSLHLLVLKISMDFEKVPALIAESQQHENIDFLLPACYDFAIFKTKGAVGTDFVLITPECLVLTISTHAVDDYEISWFTRSNKSNTLHDQHMDYLCFATYTRGDRKMCIEKESSNSSLTLHRIKSNQRVLDLSKADMIEPLESYTRTNQCGDMAYNELHDIAKKLATVWDNRRNGIFPAAASVANYWMDSIL